MAADTSLPLAGIVLVEERQQYGSTVYHPANDLARGLAALIGTKTIPMRDVGYIKDLGLTVQTTGATPRQL